MPDSDLYEFAPVAYCSFDPGGVIRAINLTGAGLLGVDRPSLIGQPFASVVKLQDPAVFRRHLAACFDERTPVTTELTFKVLGGSPVVTLMSSTPVFGAGGGVLSCSTAITDLTEMRRAEQERLRLLDRAEEARKMAETASRARDELLATVSHELRTPLAAMLMWTGVLRNVTDEETRLRALDAIDFSVRSQSRLIDDLLDVSRGANGKLRLDMRVVDYGAVIEESIRTQAPAAVARGVNVDVKLVESCVVRGDPNRLQQVIGNLVSNAIKFTARDGHVQVRSSLHGEQVKVTVADDGEGIEAAFLPHVFEPFRQQDGSSTRAHAGLGLGLAIVRELVSLHGGSVAAESPGPGRGSTFSVCLPRAVGERPAAPAPVPGAPVRLDGVRVLVVDDHATTLDGFARVLRRQGAEVKAAASAEEALDAMERQTFDVLLSDIAMPGEDGYGLLRRVRAREAETGRTIPAAALTARTSQRDREEALRAGFQTHCAKPLEPRELLAVVARLAKRT